MNIQKHSHSVGIAGHVRKMMVVLDAVPYTLLAIPLRLAIGWVFWSSALVHLASWDTTLALFADEYKVPLLPPELAAQLGVAIEVAAPILLALGMGTRLAAFALLSMTTVIEVFVYPQAWPTHIQWAAMLLVLVCRGPGAFSIDHLLARYFWPSRDRDRQTISR
jgi:putative oxidoreductase